jgi:hypothetical protein
VAPGTLQRRHLPVKPSLGQVSEWGETGLENGEYVPHEAGLFLSCIRSQIPNLDPIVDWYLMEALNSFRSGAYLAVAVMTGIAAERILIV